MLYIMLYSNVDYKRFLRATRGRRSRGRMNMPPGEDARCSIDDTQLHAGGGPFDFAQSL